MKMSIARILTATLIYFCMAYGLGLGDVGFWRALALGAVTYPVGCLWLKMLGVKAF